MRHKLAMQLLAVALLLLTQLSFSIAAVETFEGYPGAGVYTLFNGTISPFTWDNAGIWKEDSINSDPYRYGTDQVDLPSGNVALGNSWQGPYMGVPVMKSQQDFNFNGAYLSTLMGYEPNHALSITVSGYNDGKLVGSKSFSLTEIDNNFHYYNVGLNNVNEIRFSSATNVGGQDGLWLMDNLNYSLINQQPKTYGLFMGINDGYDCRGDLAAERFRDQLVQSKVLEQRDTILLTGKSFSTSEIENALNSFSLNADDKLYLFFNGHGSTFKPEDKNYWEDPQYGENTKSEGDEFILTHGIDVSNFDSDQIMDHILTDDELTTILKKFDQIEKWVILDSCRAGGFWGNGLEGEGDLEQLRNIILVASSSETKNSLHLGGTGGLLTSALINAFELDNGVMNADKNKDGFISPDELERYLNVGYDWAPLVGTEVNYQLFGEYEFGKKVIFTSDMWSPFIIASNDFNGKIATPVPEPATIFLLSTGIIGLIGYSRRF